MLVTGVKINVYCYGKDDFFPVYAKEETFKSSYPRIDYFSKGKQFARKLTHWNRETRLCIGVYRTPIDLLSLREECQLTVLSVPSMTKTMDKQLRQQNCEKII